MSRLNYNDKISLILGLLIKRILQLADSDPRFREMKRNTIGVIFYSTPHHGSSLAKYSNQAKYMLYPSIEVQELNKGINYFFSYFAVFVVSFALSSLCLCRSMARILFIS